MIGEGDEGHEEHCVMCDGIKSSNLWKECQINL